MSASDRIPLLRAILTSPTDDLPRLVFADYLEESGTTDLDKATVEFIRVSCNSSGKKLMPMPAYVWLRKNWKRLVPGFVDRNDKVFSALRQDGRVQAGAWLELPKGRKVITKTVVPYNTGGSLQHSYSTRFTFDRGFLVEMELWSTRAFQHIAFIVRQDQPLVTFPVGMAYVNSYNRRISKNPLDDLKINETAR